jgi:hypothetical protein
VGESAERKQAPAGPDLYLCHKKTILWRSRDRRLVSLPVVDSPKDEWFPQGTNDQVAFGSKFSFPYRQIKSLAYGNLTVGKRITLKPKAKD